MAPFFVLVGVMAAPFSLKIIPFKSAVVCARLLLARLRECHGLTEAIFADVNAHLADKGITLRSGTLVDATVIDAPSSTKNQARVWIGMED